MKDDAKKAYIFTDTSTINLKARNFELKGPCHEKSFLNENVGNISGGKDISDWIFTILLCPCNFLRILNDGVVKVQYSRIHTGSAPVRVLMSVADTGWFENLLYKGTYPWFLVYLPKVSV